MKEIGAKLWDVDADLRVITTNGFVTKDGRAVMGRGCALEARRMIPGIHRRLGRLLEEHGNRPMRLCRFEGADLASFPVKHHWKDAADPDLVAGSARLLVELVDKFGYQRIVLPRPGAGNGRLRWCEVRPLLAEVLDDRFTVVTFPAGSHPKRSKTPVR